MSSRIGYQDLTALLARQPGVAERFRERIVASPFGTIHAATFSFPRPLGSAIPDPVGFSLAGLSTPEIQDSVGARAPFDLFEPEPPILYPAVNRELKGDRLIPKVLPHTPAKPDDGAKQRRPQMTDTEGAGQASGADRVGDSNVGALDHSDARHDASGAASTDAAESAAEDHKIAAASAFNGHARPVANFYFGLDLGSAPSVLEPWAAGEQPVPVMSSLDDANSAELDHEDVPQRAKAGESAAGKGEVTGEEERPKSPAEQLALSAGERSKAENCLANAIYFEARSEPERGQQAVAQVVLNRVFSSFYPKTICGVVYQNAHRRLACQFTFACDGIPDRVAERTLWDRAKQIAKDMLDGKIWLAEVGKSTHYHADYVSPWWARSMRRNYKIGAHIFYRPRKWGDGSEEPVWGSAARVQMRDAENSL